MVANDDAKSDRCRVGGGEKNDLHKRVPSINVAGLNQNSASIQVGLAARLMGRRSTNWIMVFRPRAHPPRPPES